MIGPLVGGLFAGADQILWITGWRWVFLINVPVGIIALFMVIAFLHLPHTPHAKPRIDWWGAGLVVATLAPFLLVAEQGREWGWTSVASITCYVIGAAGLIGFILVERAMGSSAIIPLSLFSKSSFSVATVLSILVGFGMFGAMLTLPLYIQIVLGYTPTQSGFATLPMMAGIMLASIGTGQIVARTGKYSPFPKLGTGTTALGFLILPTCPGQAVLVPRDRDVRDRPRSGPADADPGDGRQASVETHEIGVATSSAPSSGRSAAPWAHDHAVAAVQHPPTNISGSLTDEKHHLARPGRRAQRRGQRPVQRRDHGQDVDADHRQDQDQVADNLADATDQVRTPSSRRPGEGHRGGVMSHRGQRQDRRRHPALGSGLDKLAEPAPSWTRGQAQGRCPATGHRNREARHR